MYSTEFQMLCFAYIFLTSKILVNINLGKFHIRKQYHLLCPKSIIIHNLDEKFENMYNSSMLKSWEKIANTLNYASSETRDKILCGLLELKMDQGERFLS